MGTYLVAWLFVALAISCNVAANILFRKAIHSVDVSSGSVILIARGVLLSPWFWMGMISSVVLLGSYLLAIRWLPLSTSYAIVTASVTACLFYYGIASGTEAFNAKAAIGLLAILGGVFLIVTASKA